jgi:hypothetical protein
VAPNCADLNERDCIEEDREAAMLALISWSTCSLVLQREDCGKRLLGVPRPGLEELRAEVEGGTPLSDRAQRSTGPRGDNGM